MTAKATSALFMHVLQRLALPALAILFAAGTAQADVDAMAQFRFQGMPLGTQFREFIRHHPSAIARHEKSDETLGLKVYFVLMTEVADSAEFSFLNYSRSM